MIVKSSFHHMASSLYFLTGLGQRCLAVIMLKGRLRIFRKNEKYYCTSMMLFKTASTIGIDFGGRQPGHIPPITEKCL